VQDEDVLEVTEVIAEAAPPTDDSPVPLASVDDPEAFQLEGAFEAPGMAWETAHEAAAESPELATPTIGELYFNQGHTGKAIEVYRQVVEQDPGNERARARLAELEALERHLRAEEANELRRMVTAAPKDPRAARRAALERTIGRLEGLMAAFKGGRA
jgi:thioredoxin-like negative regulator of GroEL